MVQLGRQALPMPGNAKHDLWIIQQLAKRLDLNWHYFGADDESQGSGAAAVYEEMRQAMHTAIAGITWARLEKEGSVTYPCLSEDDPGQPIVFQQDVPTKDGRIKLVPAGFIPANESPDAEYPYVLITGRQLEHWHTGSMTRRASVLDAIEPQATVSMNSSLAHTLRVQAGEMMEAASRRGSVRLQVRIDEGTPEKTVFIPFAYSEAAANLLTNAALDPIGKIPEFKYCAVALRPVTA
jgi:formate dehydrogenase major subunit